MNAPNLAAADALMGIFGLKRAKPKRCKACKQMFTPFRPLQRVCSPACAHQEAIINREKLQHGAKKAERAETKAKIEALKRLSDVADDAQKVFNAYIRARDIAAGHGCISCGTRADVQYAAGHYRSRGGIRPLRFNEDNVFLQCNKNCNSKKGGNSIEMRKGMIARIGVERVEAVENYNETKKWTREELYAIKEIYRAKLRALKEREGQ